MNTIIDINERKEKNRRSIWQLTTLQGLVLVLLGIFLIGEPFKTLSILTQLMGIFFIVSGAIDLVKTFLNKTDRSRVWTAVSSLINIIAGVVVLSAPLMSGIITTTLLVIVLAITAIINGILQMAVGRIAEDGLGREWSWPSFLFGLVNLVFGFILISAPLFAEATLLVMMPFWAFIGGVCLIILSLGQRSNWKASREINHQIEQLEKIS